MKTKTAQALALSMSVIAIAVAGAAGFVYWKQGQSVQQAAMAVVPVVGLVTVSAKQQTAEGELDCEKAVPAGAAELNKFVQARQAIEAVEPGLLDGSAKTAALQLAAAAEVFQKASMEHTKFKCEGSVAAGKYKIALDNLSKMEPNESNARLLEQIIEGIRAGDALHWDSLEKVVIALKVYEAKLQGMSAFVASPVFQTAAPVKEFLDTYAKLRKAHEDELAGKMPQLPDELVTPMPDPVPVTEGAAEGEQAAQEGAADATSAAQAAKEQAPETAKPETQKKEAAKPTKASAKEAKR